MKKVFFVSDMAKFRYQNVYFILCVLCLIGLGAIRSQPVYGKLDFLLLDGRPWWTPWHTMIDQVIAQGRQPIVSDLATSTVLRAVFAQEAILFRLDRRHVRLDVDTLETMSRIKEPVGALLMLLGKNAGVRGKLSMATMLTEVAQKMAAREDGPYRCLINLRGFTPSWVPVETGHWSMQWADTAWFYEYMGQSGKNMEQLLRLHPPLNCIVYY